jgi:osmotically-inducible protein OsmY
MAKSNGYDHGGRKRAGGSDGRVHSPEYFHDKIAFRAGAARYRDEADQDSERVEPLPDRGSFRGEAPQSYIRSDERIHEEVDVALTDDDHLDATSIEVTVEKGLCILKGTVDDRTSKHRAEEIAGSITGVSDVRNELRVSNSISRIT